MEKNLFLRYFSKQNLLKHFTVKNVCYGFFVIILAGLIRYSGFPGFILLFLFNSNPEWACLGLSSILALPLKLVFKGVFDGAFEGIDFSILRLDWNLLKFSYLKQKILEFWLGVDSNNGKMTIGGNSVDNKPSIKPINTGKLSTAHMVNQGQPGGNQQGGNQPVGDTQPKPEGGFLKFRCMYWLSRDCDSWVSVNNAPCASCLAQEMSSPPRDDPVKGKRRR